MNDLAKHIEAILFAVAKPVSLTQLMKALSSNEAAVSGAIEEIRRAYEGRGIRVMEHAGKVSLVTSPECEEVLKQFVKEDLSGELTRPSLETLTVIAYRGPITKPEIEQIRGVNCSLILRNLLMRDMIVEEPDEEKLQPAYRVSEAFLRHMGVVRVEDLPSYEAFAHHEEIDRLLADIGMEDVSRV